MQLNDIFQLMPSLQSEGRLLAPLMTMSVKSDQVRSFLDVVFLLGNRNSYHRVLWDSSGWRKLNFLSKIGGVVLKCWNSSCMLLVIRFVWRSGSGSNWKRHREAVNICQDRQKQRDKQAGKGESEADRQKENKWLCVHVCVWERGRQREERENERQKCTQIA